jgi:hypothetical protein
MESKSGSVVAELVKDIALCKSVGDSLTPLIWESTVPIVSEKDDKFRQHGTGTLLSIAQRLFLVTAAHVFRQARSNSLALHLPNQAGDAWLRIFLDFRCLRADGFDDSIDLAISEMDEDSIAFLQSYKSVKLLDLDTTLTFTDDVYCVCGFPSELAAIDPSGASPSKITKLFGLTALYKGSTSLVAYDSRYNILLDAEKSNAVKLIDGCADLPSNFKGISGCSIWKTNLAVVGRAKWTPANARIVAVQTSEYESAKAIKGTSWKAATTLLYKGWPELQPAMGLILPRS